MIPRLVNGIIALVIITPAINAQKWTHLQSFQSATNTINQMLVHPAGNMLYCAGYAFDSLLLTDSIFFRSNGYTDCIVYKTDTSGKMVLLHQFGGAGNDLIGDFKFTKSNNMVVTGRFQKAMKKGDSSLVAPKAEAFFLAELSNDSTPVWSVVSNAFSGNSVGLLENGTIAVAGLFKDSMEIVKDDVRTSRGGDDMYLALFDSAGKARWSHTFGCGINDLYPRCVTSGNNIFVSGVFFDTLIFDTSGDTICSESMYENTFFARYDTNGTFMWKKVIASTGIAQLRHTFIDSVGNIYFCGIYSATMHIDSLYSTSNDESSMFLAKLDASGKPLWIESVDRASANCIIAGKEGDLFVAGSYRMNATFDSISLTARDIEDVFAANYSADGTCKSIVAGGCCRSATASLLAMSGSDLFVAGTVDAVLIHRTCTIDFGGLEIAFNNESAGRTFLAVADPYPVSWKPQYHPKKQTVISRQNIPARYFDLSGRELPGAVKSGKAAGAGALKAAPAAIIRDQDGKRTTQVRY